MRLSDAADDADVEGSGATTGAESDAWSAASSVGTPSSSSSCSVLPRSRSASPPSAVGAGSSGLPECAADAAECPFPAGRPPPLLLRGDAQPPEAPSAEAAGGEQPAGPPKAKRPADPAASAQRRVRLRLREEVRAARRARRRERALAKKRRGAGHDIEAFAVRTVERLRAAAREARPTSPSAAEAEPPRGGSLSCEDLEGFRSRTRSRLLSQAAARREEAAARGSARAGRAAALAEEGDLEEFRRKTQERVVRRLWSRLPQVREGLVSVDDLRDGGAPVFARRRIAIVGAGPVGLWAAVLLAEKYGRGRSPDAPEITILESRPEEAHCARTDIRIALSSSTQALLNGRCRMRCFASGMPVAEIEAALLHRWRKHGQEGSLRFGQEVGDPLRLAEAEAFDCILWAAGRRSLGDGARSSLGCEVQLGSREQVLVFQLGELAGGGDVWQLAASDLTGLARQAAARPALRVMLRPGAGDACSGWLWLFGLPADVLPEIPAAAPSGLQALTIPEALEALLGGTAPPGALALAQAARALQQRLRPTACSARWVEAAFWSSDRTVCELGRPEGSVEARPLVLLGDAACGKPFYTGTTLNRHLWDVAALVDELDWRHDGRALACARFAPHEQRYQAELRRIEEFQRRGAPRPPPPGWSEPPRPPSPRPSPRASAQGPPERAAVRRVLSLPQLERAPGVDPLGAAEGTLGERLLR